MSAGELLSMVDPGRIPFPVILVFLLSVAGVVASGKPAETFGRMAACILTYLLLSAVAMSVNGPDTEEYIRRGKEGVPFLNAFFGNGQSVRSLLVKDFSAFSGEFLKLFLFCAVVDTMLTVFDPLARSVGGVNVYCLGLLLPWIVRYIICCGAVFVYAALYAYAISPLPEWLCGSLALVIVVMTALMLLSPLVNFLILWADLVPNRFIRAVSAFVKDHKVGGVMQVSFFTAFMLLSVLMGVQEAAPALPGYLTSG